MSVLPAAGLVALHFNAELFRGWTRPMAMISGGFAVLGAGLVALSLGRSGWTRLEHWPAHIALALNAVLAIGFLLYGYPA